MGAGERMDRFELDLIAAPSGFSSLVKAGSLQLQLLLLHFYRDLKETTATTAKESHRKPSMHTYQTRGLVSSQRCLTDAGFSQDYYFNHSMGRGGGVRSEPAGPCSGLAHVPGWPSLVAPVLSSAGQMALRWSTPLGEGAESECEAALTPPPPPDSSLCWDLLSA